MSITMPGQDNGFVLMFIQGRKEGLDMADIATLTVYNHYLTSYAPKGTTSFDTHKRSELRNIYNSIVKLNKESPLYLLDNSADSKAYAIGLKENARELKNTISSLGGFDEDVLDEAAFLNKKEAYSGNEAVASVSYIGNMDDAAFAPTLALEVHSLASPQVNMGHFIPSSTAMELTPETYSFDLSINDLNYEFQFQVNSDDTNIDVQNRLMRLVNNADIGITAEVIEDGEGNSSLKLTSQKNGTSEDRKYVFRISDGQTSKTAGVVDYLGIDKVSRTPSNAEFTIDGTAHSSSSNTFTLEKNYQVTLNGVSPEGSAPINIGMKTDVENLTGNLQQLAGGYNQFLRAAIEYTQKHPRSNQLVSEMWHLAGSFSESLSDIGMNIEEDGSIQIDENMLQQSIQDGKIENGFEQIKNFTKALYRKSGQVSLNPMTYVDKVIVAYKNPGKNFASPYITSAYSGMMFNSYC